MSEISPEEIDAFSQAFLIRYGIDFTCYERGSFTRRLQSAMRSMQADNPNDLWVKLLREPDAETIFISHISVGMTSMFRDPTFWKFMKTYLSSMSDKYVPKIWHAGCATGEEVFSMAILLRALNHEYAQGSLATDFNSHSLAEVRKSAIHQLKWEENQKQFLEVFPELKLEHYGKWEEQYFCLPIHEWSMPQVLEHNLTSLVPPGKDFDMIFCRNVLIYFDLNMKKRILDMIWQSLKPGGLLIIGFFDALNQIIDFDKFEFFDEGAKILAKKK
jgi:chemotaxis protein methyltransferase CheR